MFKKMSPVFSLENATLEAFRAECCRVCMDTPNKQQKPADVATLAEHAEALTRLCFTRHADTFRTQLEFLNDDGWTITKTPRDAEFAKNGGAE